MKINLVQLVISIMLFAVLGFGIGFIINMILRTTWLPVVITAGVIVGTIFYYQITLGTLDIIMLTVGLAGSVLSGWAINVLRKKGYRMF